MPKVRKYLWVAKLHLSTSFEYRANFLLIRLRNLVGLATMFMIWQAVYRVGGPFRSYSQEEIFGYLLFGTLFNAFTWSNWTSNLQGTISNGNLNDYLLKPLNIFTYVLSEELSEKVADILFTSLEILVLYVLFKPPLNWHFKSSQVVIVLVLIPLVWVMRFLVSLCISFTTFWYYQGSGWGQRFLIDMLLDFMAGTYFPLEFYPIWMVAGLVVLPTSLFYYTPMQVVLGRLSLLESGGTIVLTVFWIGVFYGLALWLWKRGLRVYGAFGR